MSDRLDIDALLIGSLYGELSSAEEARLQAHLESHPADRTALADLTYARTAVRESRIFQVQAEPPQQISALLMQEAARRAPKPQEAREGWFARFIASLRHPAMAAAAMLVVVVGVAGTLYVRKGDHFAKQSKSATPALTAGSSASASGSPGSAAPDPLAAADSKALALSEDQAVATGQAAPEGAAIADDFRVSLEDDADAQERKEAEGDGRDRKAVAKRQGTIGGMEVSTPSRRPMPKELPADEASAPAKQAKRDFAEPPAAAKPAPERAKKGSVAPTTVPAPSPPPPPAPTTGFGADRGGAPAARAPAGNAQAPAQIAKDQKPTDKETTGELAWAKTQHAKVAARVRAGQCGDAASLAVQISTRVPAYYQQHVEHDRDLKSCFTAIHRAREAEVERAQKARATRSNEEAAPRPADSK